MKELYNLDCIECLRDQKSSTVDVIITSPPYNLGTTTGGGFPTKNKGKWSGGGLANGYNETHSDSMPALEYKLWQQQFLIECWRVLADNGAIFYNHKCRVQNGVLQTPLELNPGLPLRQIIVWKRSGGINFSGSFYLPTTEWVLIFAKPAFRLKSKGASGIGDVWEFRQDIGNPHPAPFPLQLPLNILDTVDCETVMDPFMGSGTVGVAAALNSKNFIGVEKDAKFFDMASVRIELAESGDMDSWLSGIY